jgi:single-strand DNA-binding protein
MNRVFLMGNLTRDPELRHTASGTAVGDLRLAISDTYRDKSGQTVESTCFADVVVWGRQAEACEQYLRKGSPCVVEGRLQLDQWETAEGDKRSRLRVCANRVQFLGRPRRGNGETEDSTAPEPETAAVGAPGEESLPF